MSATLVCDHRILYGAEAVVFLGASASCSRVAPVRAASADTCAADVNPAFGLADTPLRT
jgi:hypothetical protein